MEAPNPHLNNGFVFVDTCVVQFAGHKNKSKSEAVLACLDSLTYEELILCISEITLYESLHGLWGKKSEEVLLRLNTYKQKEVSSDILRFASLLGGLYHEEKIDGIDTGDKIIASTAILEKGFILTTNHKDFPHPFFLTEQSFALSYKVGHFIKTLDLALYKPNFSLIARRIEENNR